VALGVRLRCTGVRCGGRRARLGVDTGGDDERRHAEEQEGLQAPRGFPVAVPCASSERLRRGGEARRRLHGCSRERSAQVRGGIG